MALYTWLNLIVLSGPLILSFDKRVSLWKKLPQLLLSILPVSLFFIIWDILVTDLGHWSFSSKYAGEFTLFHLPLGEWLFFLAAPYACLFIYEVVVYYLPEKNFIFDDRWFVIFGLPGLLPLLFWSDRGYTVIVGIIFLAVMVMIYFFGRQEFHSRRTLYALLISYLPFLIFNGIFTALPIVSYNPAEIIGLRIITIPLEDFFYNFSLLAPVYLLYFKFDKYLRAVKN